MNGRLIETEDALLDISVHEAALLGPARRLWRVRFWKWQRRMRFRLRYGKAALAALDSALADFDREIDHVLLYGDGSYPSLDGVLDNVEQKQ